MFQEFTDPPAEQVILRTVRSVTYLWGCCTGGGISAVKTVPASVVRACAYTCRRGAESSWACTLFYYNAHRLDMF